MKTGDYGHMRNIQYDGPSRQLFFEFSVYVDDTKTQETGKLHYNLGNMSETATGVIAKQDSPPTSPNDGDMYLIGSSSPSGAWVDNIQKNENDLVEWSEENVSWSHTTILGLPYLYLESDGKYYSLEANILTEEPLVVDSRLWDVLFKPGKIGKDNNTDIIKQCYTYLKTRPEFSEVVDA